MNPCELQLKPGASLVRPTAGVFLAGHDATAWLEELCGWGLPQEELRLFIVPRAARDPSAGGLLVLLPTGAALPRETRGLLLGVVEGRLFLPVDAELSPPVTAAEVRELCRAEVTLFHPGLGAVEFEHGDGRRVWDLLARPALDISADWNAAIEGATLSSRLMGVTLLALPGNAEIYGDAADEIGPEPITELPPARNEPSDSAAGRMQRALRELGAKAVVGLVSLFPSGGTRRTWLNDVLDWAAARLASVSEEMEQVRNRELHRLAEMLDTDPERGLRHALPLAGPPPRGRAAPGTQLGTSETQFDLSRVGGGQASDQWAIPEELRRRLLARYRELALREQRLGRFQRAAYIHAHLLGDLSAAAAVLKEGRYFAEAAALYRDHLHQASAAAECYAAGGFFAEAIAIYEADKAWLKIGELHRQLGDEPAAETAFRRAIEEKVAAGDLIAAAGLHEDRLQAHDEALKLLGNGWPDAPQAAACLKAEFFLLGKLGRHEAARQRLGALVERPVRPHRRLDLAEVMKAVSGTYPDHTIRPVAADLARVKVSEALGSANAEELRRGVRILNELAPEDRLLARDTSRFVAEWLRAHAPKATAVLPTAKPGANRLAAPQVVQSFPLAMIDAVETVRRFGRDFIAIARWRDQWRIVRGQSNGQQSAYQWVCNQVRRETLRLVVDEHEINPASASPFATPLPDCRPLTMPAREPFPNVSLEVPPWLPASSAALAKSAGQWWVLRDSAGEFILESRAEDGRLVGSTSFTPWLEELTEPVETVSLLALQTNVWVALGPHLFLFNGDREPQRWVCEYPIVGLESSAPFLPRAAIARCTHGACVFWADSPKKQPEMLATDLVAPHAAFLRGGALVLLSTAAQPGGYPGRVLDLDRRGVHGSVDFSWSKGHPQALIGTETPTGFAIFTRDGEVHVHNVSATKR